MNATEILKQAEEWAADLDKAIYAAGFSHVPAYMVVPRVQILLTEIATLREQVRCMTRSAALMRCENVECRDALRRLDPCISECIAAIEKALDEGGVIGAE